MLLKHCGHGLQKGGSPCRPIYSSLPRYPRFGVALNRDPSLSVSEVTQKLQAGCIDCDKQKPQNKTTKNVEEKMINPELVRKEVHEIVSFDCLFFKNNFLYSLDFLYFVSGNDSYNQYNLYRQLSHCCKLNSFLDISMYLYKFEYFFIFILI